ncbi:MAG: serine/threonine-protein kinase [Pseudomonadota bacterium]
MPQDKDFWQAAKRLFREAKSHAAGDRQAYLRQACGSNSELYDQVMSLLATESHASDSISDIVSQVAKLAVTDDLPTGETVGRYRVIKNLGEGGMGSVYLGERIDEDFEQRVAIKVLASRHPTPEIVKRFRSERQILANLEHPNIARLIDGGETQNGLPFLVMEYVSGTEIDDYCDADGLSIRQRLKLFRQVCRAVEYAHRNLVVHRDIKPSNILVTEDGVPKLLDFGIARLLDTSSSDRPETLYALTPDYASPEHVLGKRVTTSSDIYSLGVLLYELLTGKRPHDFTGKRPSEIEHELFHSLPDRPSRSKNKEQSVRRQLAGELDNIVMMALRADADERYASVGELSNDVQNYLEGKPIQAVEHRYFYLLSKFVSRNRIAVAGSAIFLMSLLIGGIYHVNQVTAERDRVRLEAQKTAAVSEFLKDIFRVANPDQSHGQAISATEILDRGAEKLKSDLYGQPDIRAELLATVGTVYGYLGSYDSAVEKLTEAIELSRELNQQEDLANRLLELGSTQYLMGDTEDSRNNILEAGRIIQRVGLQGTTLHATQTYEMGQALFHLGKYDEALEKTKEALALGERLKSEGGDLVAMSSLHAIGQIFHFQGKLDDSESYLRRSLDAISKRASSMPTTVQTYKHDLAAVLHDKRDYQEAEKLYLEVYEEEPKLLGVDFPNLDVGMSNLGRLYKDMGQYEKSEKFLREAIAHSNRVRGEVHQFSAYNNNNLGRLLTEIKRYEEAEVVFEQVLDVYTQTLEPDNPYIASALLGYSALLFKTQRHDQAEPKIRRAIEIFASAVPDDHFLAVQARTALGESLLGQGKLQEAGPILKGVWDGLSEKPADDPAVVRILERLVRWAEQSDSAAEARKYRSLLQRTE